MAVLRSVAHAVAKVADGTVPTRQVGSALVDAGVRRFAAGAGDHAALSDGLSCRDHEIEFAVPPSLSTRRSRSPLLRVFSALGVVTVVALVAWAVVVALLWGYAWVRLGGIDLRPVEEESESPPLGSLGLAAPDGAVTALVVLTEPRDPTRPVEPELAAPLALVQAGGPREEPAVLLISPEIPVDVAGEGRLPVAEIHARGGADLLLASLRDYTEIRIDHVVRLTVDALPELVDALGPVELCLPDGCRVADGSTVRAELRSGDGARVARVVAAAVHGIAPQFRLPAVVRSPFATRQAVEVVAGEIETDVSLRGRELLRVASLFAEPVTPQIGSVPVLRHPTTDELVPLEEATMVRFGHFRDGTPLTTRDADDELRALDHSRVAVAVLNGAGIAGLAARVESHLVAEGFVSVGTGNAAAFERERALVSYRGGIPDVELAAIRIAELLDDAELEALPSSPRFEGDEVDIVVTAGASLDDVVGGGA